jgi:hypothetical protein
VVDNVIVYRDVYRAHSFNESHGIESLYAFMDSNGCRGRFELTTFGYAEWGPSGLSTVRLPNDVV